MLFLYKIQKNFFEIAKIFHGLKIMMEDIFSTYSYGCLTFHSMSRQLLHSLAYEQTYATLIFQLKRMRMKISKEKYSKNALIVSRLYEALLNFI